LLRRSAPRNDEQPHSRDTNCPSCSSMCPSKIQRAQGMPGDGLTHGPPATRKAGGSHHRFSRINRRAPCAMVLRLISRSPRCAGLDSHRHSQIIIRELDPSVGGPGPHDFAVRISRARLAQRTRPSHPAPNVRDDRETPLLWERDARSNTRFPIFVNRNFRAGEPEGPDQLEATREFSFFAQAILVA
jgi:hypothetical protein